MKKQLADDKLLKELRDSAFFRGRVSPTSVKPSPPKPTPSKTKKKTVSTRQPKQVPILPKEKKKGLKTNLQTYRLTDSVSNRVTDLQSYRLTEFADYEIPDYRELKRGEMRLTWEQDKYLNGLESEIIRDMPEGERSDPHYKRITKNSIIRALVEIARRLELTVDAKRFRNERDLTKALAEEIASSISKSDLQSYRVPESVSNRVTE